MCGIFGFVGKEHESTQSALKVIQGLKHLEYRGYDSYGIAYKNGCGLKTAKRVGKISEVSDEEILTARSHISIGHTRWATHGGVTEINAHPHFNKDKTLAVVHNGIIENHIELKEWVETQLGFNPFISETDTEVIAHCVDVFLKQGKNLEESIAAACGIFEGRYAFAAICNGCDEIFGVMRGSPLVIGVGNDGHYLSSDQGALPQTVRKSCILEEGEFVRLGNTGGPKFYLLRNMEVIDRRLENFTPSISFQDKEHWPHFMLKEVMEQQTGLNTVLASAHENAPHFHEIIASSKNVFLTGCGTAGYVAMIGSYLFSQAGIHAEYAPSSEFGRLMPLVGPKTVIIAISQSGETADVLAIIEEAKKREATIISVLNTERSNLGRLSRLPMYIGVGKERAVASTKAATAQMLMLAYLAAQPTGVGKKDFEEDISLLSSLFEPQTLGKIERIARSILESAKTDGMFIIGRDVLCPIALEGALKIQEVSYIHAMGFAGGELKHGPIALISKDMPAVVLVGDNIAGRETVNNASELKARGARIIGISETNAPVFDRWIELPKSKRLLPIAALIPLQLLAYYLAVHLRLDPDMPRNLAKSVTVK